MSTGNSEFREELTWNSYFVDGIYDSIEAEVQFAAEQFEQEHDTEIAEDEIEQIVETIVDNGLNGIASENDDE